MQKNIFLVDKNTHLSGIFNKNISKNGAKINKARVQLMAMVMIAFVWCYKVGDYLDKHVKAIVIKKHEHRTKSIFKYRFEHISAALLNAKNQKFSSMLLKIFI